MNITLYKLTQNRLLIAKNVNSYQSKILTGSLKSYVDISNPTITIEATYNDIMIYNYVYIKDLSRYYFITNITLLDNNLIELSLHVDVLKTYQSYITQFYGYVERSYNQGNNLISDNLLPLLESDYITESKTDDNTTSGVTVDKWSSFKSENANIFVIYFVTTDSSIATIKDIYPENNILNGINNIFNGDNLNTTAIITNKTGLASWCSYMLNHTDYAKSVLGIYAMPFEPTHDTTVLSSIYLGKNKLTIGGTGDEIQGTFYNYYDTYNVLADFSLENDIYPSTTPYYWLNYKSKFQLWIPFDKWIDLEFSQVKNDRLQLSYLVKASTGKAVISLVDITTNQLIYTSSVNIGTELPLPTSNAETLKNQAIQESISNAIKIVGGVALTGVGVASANPLSVVGGVSGVVSGVAGVAKTTTNTITKATTTLSGSVNSSSDFMSLPLTPRIRSLLKVPTIKGDSTAIERYKKEFGLPCKKVLLLDSLNGYGQVTDFQVNTHIHCTTTEMEEIKELLAKGVLFSSY